MRLEINKIIMRKKLYYCFCCVLFISNFSFSQAYQDDDFVEKSALQKSKISDKLVFGGNIGLAFGTDTYIHISPLIGYKATNRLTTGIGLSYTYVKYSYDYEGHSYGGSVFAEFVVVKSITDIIPLNLNFGLSIYGENNLLNVKNLYKYDNVTWINNPMLGISLRLPISQRTYASFMVLYNFNESRYSPYTNPVIRISFNF